MCDALGPAGTKDFLGVLMHELGHTVGLNHAQISTAEDCGGLFFLGSTWGVMRSENWISQLSRARRLYTDDLSGLAAYFDWLGVPWKRGFQLAFFESSDAGVTWGPKQAVTLSMPGARTRPSVTSSTDEGEVMTSFQAVAYTDVDDAVQYFTRVAGGFSAVTAVPGALTQYPPAIAYGEGRLMIAWVASQSLADRHSNIQWAIRDTEPPGELSWSFGDYVAQTSNATDIAHKEIGLAYDPGTELFIISAMNSTDIDAEPGFPESQDGKPLFIGVRPDSGQVYGVDGLSDSVTVSEVPVLRSIGKPVCHRTVAGTSIFPSLCAVPVVAAVPGGPEAHILYVAFEAQEMPNFLTVGAFALQPLGVVSHGLIDLAGDTLDPANVRFVGAWATASEDPPEAPTRFEVFRTRLDPMQDPAGVEPVTADDRDMAPGAPPGAPVLPAWPAAIGSQTVAGGGVVFSAWHVDPAQEDEDETGGENPTTGLVCNDVGDSDSATGATSSSTTDGNPASDTGDPDPPGCDCSAARSPAPWSWLALGGLALRRRRRPR